MKTRAVCALSPERVALRKVTVPDPGPDDVVVRARYSMISTGTERWVVTGQFHGPGEEAVAHPLVPGYQKVGRVVAFGENVLGLERGQWVFATTSRIEAGAAAAWGGHIEHSVCDESQVIPLPEDMDPIKASGLVLTQVGHNGGSRPPVKKRTVALVVGDGLVGQWVAQALRRRGARVVLAGRRPERLVTAAEHSADVTVNVHDVSLDAVAAEEAPKGFDIVADTVGTTESIAEVISHARHDGHLILNSYYREGNNLLDIQAIHGRELTVYSPSGWTRKRLEETLVHVHSGAMRVKELITHVIPVSRAAKAYDLVLNKPSPFLGICLDWGE